MARADAAPCCACCARCAAATPIWTGWRLSWRVPTLPASWSSPTPATPRVRAAGVAAGGPLLLCGWWAGIVRRGFRERSISSMPGWAVHVAHAAWQLLYQGFCICTHATMGLAGTLMKPEEVERAAALCAEAGAWLVLDNTCEWPCRAAAGSQLA